MTKKDYELIARAIREVQLSQPELTTYPILLVIEKLALELKFDNPCFNELEFKESCYGY